MIFLIENFNYEVNNNIVNYSIWRQEKIQMDAINWLEKKLEDNHDIKIMYALIWLSLPGYCLDDYDSVMLSYFIGCYYLSLIN